MKYRKCKDCPKYQECVKVADLRIKRRRCGFATNPKGKSTEKGGVTDTNVGGKEKGGD